MLHPHKAKLRNLLWLSRIWIWKYVCFKFIVTNLSLGLIWSIICVPSWTSIYSEYGSENINPKDTTPIPIGNCKSWTLISGSGVLSMAPLSKIFCFSCVKNRASWHSLGWGAHRWNTVNSCKIEFCNLFLWSTRPIIKTTHHGHPRRREAVCRGCLSNYCETYFVLSWANPNSVWPKHRLKRHLTPHMRQTEGVCVFLYLWKYHIVLHLTSQS